MKKWWVYILLMLICGCESAPPPVGSLVINSDLPPIAAGSLKIGLTLNPTSGDQDVLTDNLLVNGSFDLAPVLSNGSYDYICRTVTTPNGYTTFYPLPSYAYRWSIKGGKSEVKKGLPSERNQTHYLSITQVDRDSIPFSTLQNTTPLSLKKGRSLTLELLLRAQNSSVRACLVSSPPTRIVSEIITLSPHAEWHRHTSQLVPIDDVDSAYLQIQVIPRQSLLLEDSIIQHPGPSVTDIDDVMLSNPDGSSLVELLEALHPYYLRFPDGRTANGFYPGTYPLHFQSYRSDSVSIWTIHGAEYTGSFSVQSFLDLSVAISTQPILVENAGITDPTAAQRTEDIALVPKRAKYLEHISKRAEYDSLLIQIGYQMPQEEYQRRFSIIKDTFISDTVRTNFISASWLTNTESPYSEYVCDFALPALSTPDFAAYIPDEALQQFGQPQPFMLGEVHFTPSEQLDRYISPFTLRAAFLIEAEKYAHLIRGLSLYPLISTTPKDMPILLRQGGQYQTTALYHFIHFFSIYSGTHIRMIEPYVSSQNGLYSSLSSDKDNTVFYLKLANTTRHTLPYSIVLEGKDFRPTECHMLRFRPEQSTTVNNPQLLEKFIMYEEMKKIKSKKFAISLQPFEVIMMKVSPNE